MFKSILILACLFTVLVSHSNAEESIDPAIKSSIRLPKCRCVCRTTPLLKRITRRRCNRAGDLCEIRRCRKRGRRGIRCCIIFKLVADALTSTANEAAAAPAPYPPISGSCGRSNMAYNFFGSLQLSDGSELTRVKIAFCVAVRGVGKRLFDAVFDDINTRFGREAVGTLTRAREIIREAAVAADAFALAYYN